MKLPILLACTVGLVFPGCKASKRAENFQFYKETAYFHYEGRAYDRAEAQALKALEFEPDDVQMRLMLGYIELARDNGEGLSRAEQVFRGLLRQDDYRAWLGLAQALERQAILYEESAGEIETGARYTEAADPVARADELREDAFEKRAEAITWYEQVLDHRPQFLEALNGLQRLYAAQLDFERSLDFSREILRVTDAELGAWRQQLLRTSLTPSEENRLRRNERSSLELNLKTHDLAYESLMKLGRPAEALEHLDVITAADPARVDVYSRRAQILSELGRFEEALSAIEEYLRKSSEPFDHPNIQRAFQIQASCQRAIARGEAG